MNSDSDSALDNFDKFLICEIKRIEIDKWDEGLKILTDPGNDYVLNWIECSATNFRNEWNESLCKDCINCLNCGWRAKNKCDNYIKVVAE